jgi:hypothetical protein
MRQADPVEQPAHRPMVHVNIEFVFQLKTQLIERDVALFFNTSFDPVLVRGEFAVTEVVADRLGRKRASLAFQFHHVVDEFHRNPETRRSAAMAVTFFNKGNYAFTQFNWMSFGHDAILLDTMNHIRAEKGILNPTRRATL